MSGPRLQVALLGAGGRMGQAILRLAEEEGTPVHAVPREAQALDVALDAARGPSAGGETAGGGPGAGGGGASAGGGGPSAGGDASGRGAVASHADSRANPGGRGLVLVDFSAPQGAMRAIALAVDAGVPLLSGTTGVDAAFFEALDRAAERIPVLHAANMSLGVAVMRRLAREAASMLPADFDIELVELHHRHKRDSPSGTALALVQAAAEGRGVDAEAALRGSREGMVGPRVSGEIGAFGVRGGDVAGEHTLYFMGEGERIELTHRATNRDIFAAGALRAAAWLKDQPPGRYAFDDMLNT